MKVTFLGTGEAFGRKKNTSILVDDEILLDCGLHTTMQLMNLGIMEIKIIWLSHLHADHAFGLPSFLLASNEENRKEKIVILGPSGLKNYVEKILKISYEKEIKDLKYELEVKEIQSGMSIKVSGYKFSFGKMEHSFECNSISIEDEESNKLTYTGDGFPTSETLDIASQSDLLISEAYGMGENHSSIIEAAELAKNSRSKLLALVHIFRKIDVDREMSRAEKIYTPIIIPREFDTIWI